jgi:sec-independent protein translocase protein TatB
MFDIGFSELFVIALVALIVLGPERLPKAARFAGLWVRRARAQWYSVKSELENELADEELRRSLRQARSDLEEARDSLAQGGAALQRDLEQARDEVESSVRVPAPAPHADDAAAADAPAESLSPPQRPSTERTPDA